MRGQISIEFSILLLAALLAVLIASVWPGLYGLAETGKVSSMSLAHATVTKMKQNIEMVFSGDVGTRKTVYIKCPPGNWTASGKELKFYRPNYFNISTNCSASIIMGNTPININKTKVITVYIEKINNTHVNVTITQ